ncbi:sulfite exporter TauE/SafE family protein [Desulfosporosinus sp. PR]|uniref:sulfite exporter TauE/SafE family protein n=1 Tax=Candidatus Desulfosporosinus nitrosoreducens TaxID=3401928 RepID=UPI0027E7EFDB|nr:sulfite exporter TauE/SafE family protein [Desulfosporosinus sp. PR]MDQ7096654.1 sulfite exporter TauE/SafE family protein [Desulfosporosinus sp. PR]
MGVAMNTIIVVNIIIGFLLGSTSVSGFLLPIFYHESLKLNASATLSVSFFVFFIAGIIASYIYYKKGDLDLKLSCVMGIGSFVGAIIGVFLNSLIPERIVIVILYVVVLLSGISIIVRTYTSPKSQRNDSPNKILSNNIFVVTFGLLTSIICSFSGAGGPVLVMPLLVALGLNARVAIGVALFDSVFIALPAFVGYTLKSNTHSIMYLFILSSIALSIGVVSGSLVVNKIPQKPLKLAIAIFPIAIAIWKLFQLQKG